MGPTRHHIVFIGSLRRHSSDERVAIQILARAKATKGEVVGSTVQFEAKKDLGWSTLGFGDVDPLSGSSRRRLTLMVGFERERPRPIDVRQEISMIIAVNLSVIDLFTIP